MQLVVFVLRTIGNVGGTAECSDENSMATYKSYTYVYVLYNMNSIDIIIIHLELVQLKKARVDFLLDTGVKQRIKDLAYEKLEVLEKSIRRGKTR